MPYKEERNRKPRRLRLRLFRLREDGVSLRWDSEPDDLRVVVVIPARPRARGDAWGVA